MFSRARAVPLADQPGGLLSHIHAFRNDPLDMFLRASRQDEPMLEFRLGPMWVLGVFDPDLVEQILVQQPDIYAKNTRGQHLLRVLLGNSMLTTEGALWKSRRRLGQPHFRTKVLDRYRPAIARAAAATGDRWAAAEGPVDVAEEMMALTLRVATEALFGGELGRLSHVVHETLAELLDTYMWMVTLPIPGPEHLPLGPSRRFRLAQRRLGTVVDEVVARRRAAPAPAEPDLLGDWLEAGLDGEALRSEVVTMLLAAHETTANLLTWTLALLSKHPGLRRTLVDELEARDPAAPVDLRELPWLYGTLMESLRLVPPVWMMSRSTTAPVTLGGHDLPANTYVFCCTYALHRDPRFWDNPEGFDPERWHRGRPAHKMAFIPFGAGQRRCIGESFALLEAAEVLAHLLPRFRVDLVPGQSLTPKPSVTLRPNGPMWMIPHPVEPATAALRPTLAPAGCRSAVALGGAP
jgi:cytochrome P450